ncbi:heterokaryon incompatibility protein-domain-containing protein, partial [Leptodontidium sp. 2 PMI_412]
MASPQVATEEAFASARNWIKECFQTHSNCPKATNGVLPTRVLDLTMLSELLDMIQLKETTQGETGQYVALSYCWGPDGQAKTLTHATIREFKNAIVVRELPQTLRDAILVTRKLGIRYLWIDALCIIQDSDSDKARELTQMPSIYKNALLTISAAIAEDCEKGFLHDRPQIDRGFKIKDYDEEVIESRGWTFQEAWLAPRLLIYGTGQVTWRCLSCSHTHGLQEEASEKRTFENANYPLWLEGWLIIASHYSRRQVSFKTDRLPALSAIASEFYRLHFDQYLAGLWRRSLPWALLW